MLRSVPNLGPVVTEASQMQRLKPAKCGRWPTMPAAQAASVWQAASCSARPVAYPTNAGRQAKVGSAQPYQWLTHWNVLATTMSRRLGGWPPVGEVGEDRVGGGLKRLRCIGRMPEHVPMLDIWQFRALFSLRNWLLNGVGYSRCPNHLRRLLHQGRI